jgi:hypothetical protein
MSPFRQIHPNHKPHLNGHLDCEHTSKNTKGSKRYVGPIHNRVEHLLEKHHTCDNQRGSTLAALQYRSLTYMRDGGQRHTAQSGSSWVSRDAKNQKETLTGIVQSKWGSLPLSFANDRQSD